MKKTQHVKYYLAGAVSLLTFAVYIAALQNSFVDWDDSISVVGNPYIRSFDINFLKWAFFDFYAANWHPLTWMSHALDYAVWGLNPLGHHLTNNILHAVNTFLVVVLVAKLLEAVQGDQTGRPFDSPSTSHDSRFTLIAAVTTGLLFGLHPIHVESVAWVAERKDLLCALFYLLSIMMYVRYASHRTYRTYILSLGFFILALMSKPMAVSLPFVLLILDWYPFERVHSLRTFRKVLIEKIPFFALGLISSILTILAQKAGDAILSVEDVPLSMRALVPVKSIAAYLWKMTLPVNLLPFYPYPKDVSLFSAGYFFAVSLVLAITIISIVIARKHKLWLSVWSYYVIVLFPVLGIVQVGSQAMADRYTYLPSLGPFLIAGLAAAWVVRKLDGITRRGLLFKILGCATALFLFISMTYMTVMQISIWKNSIDLWNYEINAEPEVSFAYNNRGVALYALGQRDKAIEDYKKAIALRPSYINGHLNLGLAFIDKGWLDQAIWEYQIVIRLNPGHVGAHLNLGLAYAKKGMMDKAFEEYQIAAGLSTGSAEAYYRLGSFLTDIGRPDMAIEQLQIAVRLKPDLAEGHNNLAAALYNKGRIQDALEHYLIFSRLRPDNAAAHLNLGSAYGALGDLAKSIEQFQMALRLNPDFADAHYNLGMAYQLKGMMDQAVWHLEAAARLKPEDKAIRNDLARAYNLRRGPADMPAPQPGMSK